MAILTRKEFEELCGIKKSAFSSFMNRGTIIVEDDGMVDTEIPKNAMFIERWVEKKKQRGGEINAFQANIVNSNTAKSEKEHKGKEATTEHQMNVRKKQLELEKKEQEVEINRIKIAKLSGEVIPTDLVMDVFKQHFKSVTVAFHQGADNFIANIVKQTGASREDMGKMRTLLIEIVNEAVKDAAEESKLSIKHVVEEYSDKRERGEKRT